MPVRPRGGRLNSDRSEIVPCWRRWEQRWHSHASYADPLRDVALTVRLISPSGAEHTIEAFWDGDSEWVARFMPGEAGEWRWTTECVPHDSELHGLTGWFSCV